jgi:DNA polymerase I
MWTSRILRQGRIELMYLLLAAHADGAALQEVTSRGAPHPASPEPRVVSAGDLSGVVLQLEKRRPRWIWHRTQDWYPSLLAAGVELERCYDLSLCGAILTHSEFTAGTS